MKHHVPGASVTLRPGDLVYRVIEVDPPGNELHTWKVVAISVVQASAKQIKLKTCLPGSGRSVFSPDALGRAFFETPLRAIQWFLTKQLDEIASLDRRCTEARRAIAWAASQEGMTTA